MEETDAVFYTEIIVIAGENRVEGAMVAFGENLFNVLISKGRGINYYNEIIITHILLIVREFQILLTTTIIFIHYFTHYTLTTNLYSSYSQLYYHY